MRKPLCDALLARAAADTGAAMIFLTGDLGFMALEPLRQALGARFINAGVSEQNMVSAAAAMAHEGLDAWVYSIAPFCYARAFEQIRNDIAFHRLPVKLIGNGGGYGYGVMGPSHHALEDYGVLLTLAGLRVFVPVFDQDLPAVVARAGDCGQSAYLRLGRAEAPAGYAAPAYAPWRQLTDGPGALVIAVGPLAGLYLQAVQDVPAAQRPTLWALAELPLSAQRLPERLLEQLHEQLRTGQRLIVAEEHVAQGGVAAQLLLQLAQDGLPAPRLLHLCAPAQHDARQGSQTWLRERSRIDAGSLLQALLHEGLRA